MGRHYTINDCVVVANNKNGRCLSIKYCRVSDKLEWQCEKEHVWTARFSDILYNDSWCPYCAGTARIDGIKVANQIAQSKSGLCLSTKYTNCTTQKLFWECKFGHQWYATLNKVKDCNRWCPECAGTKRLTIDCAIKEAEKHNGRCLSVFYINSRSKLLWQCNLGHKWWATLGNIKNRKSWCPKCAEIATIDIKEICKIAEDRKGKCLSMQYVSGQKIHWLCEKGHKWEAVIGNVKNNRTWCPYCAGRIKRTLTDCINIAKQHNGLCLSDKYINGDYKMKWQCKCGYIWKASIKTIIKGSWCPRCFTVKVDADKKLRIEIKKSKKEIKRIAKHIIETCQKEAKKYRGKCLTEHYNNCSKK